MPKVFKLKSGELYHSFSERREPIGLLVDGMRISSPGSREFKELERKAVPAGAQEEQEAADIRKRDRKGR